MEDGNVGYLEKCCIYVKLLPYCTVLSSESTDSEDSTVQGLQSDSPTINKEEIK
jgi:hypothetical protein